MRLVLLFLLLSFLSGNCTTEKVHMTGDIIGKVKVYDEASNLLPDEPGILINLLQYSILIDTSYTNIKGQYHFKNIPYGPYKIDPVKNGYIKTYYGWYCNHIGGDSPTYLDGRIYEIPTFQISIDSINWPTTYSLNIFLKINGDTLLPRPTYGINCYFSSSPEVTMDSYEAYARGYLSGTDGGCGACPKIAVYGILTEFFEMQNLSGTVYLRIYPKALGQEYYSFSPDVLGKPSNVVSFTWE